MYTGLIWFQVTTRDMHSKMTPPFFSKVTVATCVHGSPQQVWPPLSERHSIQHWLVERTRVWRVYSATPAAGHGWAGTRQQGWGSFLLLVVQKLTGAKSGEWAARNLWWPELCEEWAARNLWWPELCEEWAARNLWGPELCEEWAARNLWWPELCEERHCCHAKCGTWSHGLQSTLDEGTHNLIPAV